MTNYWGGNPSSTGEDQERRSEFNPEEIDISVETKRPGFSREELKMALETVESGAFICLLDNVDIGKCEFSKINDDLFEIVHKNRIVGYARSDDILLRKKAG